MNLLQGKKYLWRLPDYESTAVLELASRYNLSLPIAQTLLTRGLKTKEEIDAFLFSSFERDVAHPSLMKDMDKAIDRIQRAIKAQEKILVFGDYDVDGITSSALMMICLLPLGANINFFLPNRVKDGYGISASLIERAARNGYSLIITVDNGITAFEAAAKAKALGIDLIITDHHRLLGAAPEAYAIVNPNQPDCPYPFKMLAGVGVTFKVISYFYELKNRPLPDKAKELLLLGTIADVVPLIGENRFWVRHTLAYINQCESLPFAILKQNGNISKPRLTAHDIGFFIAPQINALGRLEDARQAVKFLIGTEVSEVQEVGKILFELNQARKDIECAMLAEVEVAIAEKKIDLSKEHIIIAASNAWPPGVIGLVASRLVSAYGRPAILFHVTKDGYAKGSCRSIPEFNMFDALASCQDLLTHFGGHSMAAGLSLPIAHVAALKEHLENRIISQLTPTDLQQKLMLDAQATLPDITRKMVADMTHLEPFGNQNEQPAFYIKDVALVQKPSLLKDAHVKCHVFADGVIKPVIFFNRPELFQLLLDQGSEPFDLAAQVNENYWSGKISIELTGLDIAKRNV